MSAAIRIQISVDSSRIKKAIRKASLDLYRVHIGWVRFLMPSWWRILLSIQSTKKANP